MKLQAHRLANHFPMMDAAELDALADDIRKNGLRQPIVKWQGRVLDGRNRLAACQKAGVKPRFETFKGKDPLGFVLSQNLERRHLTPCQRAMLGADLQPQFEAEAKERQRRGKEKLPDPKNAGQARDHVGKRFRVSGRYIQQAKKILAADPEVAKRVRNGALKIIEANALLKLPAKDRAAILKRADADPRIKVRLLAQAITKARKLNGATDLATVNGKFSVIYADPPWQEPCASESRGLQYPQMTLDELRALPVAAKSADDAVLFLWTTGPRLPDAVELMKTWGFQFVNSIVWCKPKIGTGRWVRTQHEQLLIGRKGNFPCPRFGAAPSSIIHAKARAHSQKPDEIYSMIESMFPKTRKFEMFARHRHDSSWEVWGAEAPPVLKARKTIARAIAA